MQDRQVRIPPHQVIVNLHVNHSLFFSCNRIHPRQGRERSLQFIPRLEICRLAHKPGHHDPSLRKSECYRCSGGSPDHFFGRSDHQPLHHLRVWLLAQLSPQSGGANAHILHLHYLSFVCLKTANCPLAPVPCPPRPPPPTGTTPIFEKDPPNPHSIPPGPSRPSLPHMSRRIEFQYKARGAQPAPIRPVAGFIDEGMTARTASHHTPSRAADHLKRKREEKGANGREHSNYVAPPSRPLGVRAKTTESTVQRDDSSWTIPPCSENAIPRPRRSGNW